VASRARTPSTTTAEGTGQRSGVQSLGRRACLPISRKSRVTASGIGLCRTQQARRLHQLHHVPPCKRRGVAGLHARAGSGFQTAIASGGSFALGPLKRADESRWSNLEKLPVLEIYRRETGGIKAPICLCAWASVPSIVIARTSGPAAIPLTDGVSGVVAGPAGHLHALGWAKIKPGGRFAPIS